MSPAQSPYHRRGADDHPRPSLRSLQRRDALRVLGLLLLLMLPVGVLAALFPISGIIILAMLFLGLVVGLRRVVDPLSGFHQLGKDRQERLEALQQLEDQLGAPSTTRIPLRKGTLYLTDEWLVLANRSQLVLEPRQRLLWLWETEARAHFPPWRSNTRRRLLYYTRNGSLYNSPESLVLHHEDSGVLDAIAQRYPELLYGAHDEWLGRGLNTLIQKVEARRRELEPPGA